MSSLSFNFSWYDYGFRFFDPVLGRFPSLDPKADAFVELSPYNYASNNPITCIDLWGLQGIPSNDLKDKNGNLTTATSTALSSTFLPSLEPKSIQPQRDFLEAAGPISSFEMWLGSPSEGYGEAAGKIALNITYDIVNSPVSLVTGKTIGGHGLNSTDKMDAFIDVAPGLLSFGLTKTGAIVKTTGKGLEGFNDFVKKSVDATVTEGLPEEMTWQKRAGELFQTNKIDQKAIEASDAAFRSYDVIKETKDELDKD